MEIHQRAIDEALRLGAPFAPIINGAAPGENSDILPSDVTPERLELWGFSVAFGVDTVLNLIVKQNAKPDLVLGLNQSLALPAKDVFGFSVLVDPSASYNFQIETDGAVHYLLSVFGRTGAAL